DRDSLLLPTREEASLIADNGFVPVRLMHDKFMRVRLFRRIDYFVFRCIQPPVLDIAENRFVKEEGVLGYHADLLAQGTLFQCADVAPVQSDQTRFRFVKAKQQRKDRTLSR